MPSSTARCLEDLARSCGLWLLPGPEGPTRPGRLSASSPAALYFTLADGALVELDASTVDWTATFIDCHTGAVRWTHHYDIYAHALETGANVARQFARSLQEFVDLALACDGADSLYRTLLDW